MPSLNATKCKAGDLILFYGVNAVAVGQGAAKGLKVLTALPALISAVQGGAAAFQGSATCNHAAIITEVEGRRVFNLAHATSAGVQLTDVDNYLLGMEGSCQVFRMRGKFDFAAEAGRVGATWASAAANGAAGIVYSTDKGFLSAFQSSSFGSGAKQRAAFYRANKDRPGGPADIGNMLQGRAKAMFCSMFAIACYQATMSDMYLGVMLALDAKHTSPMYLDGYLKGSQHWEQINAV